MTDFTAISAPHDPGLHRADAIGRDHRHAGNGKLQRHRAGLGERCARDTERCALFLFADHDPGRDLPARHAVRDRFLQMRHGGQHGFECHALGAAAAPAYRRTPPYGAGSRCGGCPAAPAAPAARRRGVSAHRRMGRKVADLLGQGMADIAARRAAQPAIFLRFERQQRQHVIDIGAHRPRPARPPCPDRGGDIVDDRNRGIARPHAPCDPVGEIRTVDDDEHVRSSLRDRGRGHPDQRAGSSAVAARPRRAR